MSTIDTKPNLPRASKRILNDFTPTKWSSYFENQKEVLVENNIFNIYSSGNQGLVLFLIHGGGYSALTWALFSKEITKKIDCQIFAVDLRGHGNTKVVNEENLSLEILIQDIIAIIGLLFSKVTPIFLIGHSLGGSIAVSTANLIPNVVGMCVIDVVEGTALEALPSMKNILRNRPNGFKTIQEAIQWSFKDGGQTRNLEAARISMPGQIKNRFTNELAANQCEEDIEYCGQNQTHNIGKRICSIVEEETFPSSITNNNNNNNNLYTWRIDLTKTEPFWDNWFKGLSQKFLNVRVPKILLLANINRLDTALTVAQMQGKFQLQVLPQSGHAIHESQPERVADIVARFLQTQRLAFPKT